VGRPFGREVGPDYARQKKGEGSATGRHDEGEDDVTKRATRDKGANRRGPCTCEKGSGQRMKKKLKKTNQLVAASCLAFVSRTRRARIPEKGDPHSRFQASWVPQHL
jgi:hypothetical protein